MFNSPGMSFLPRARLLVLAMAALLFSERLAMAATHTAQDLTPDAVLAAIRAAQDGDTVQLPAGTSVWSKGWNTGVWLPMKSITVSGAGIDKTIIVDNTSTSAGDEPFFLKAV